MRLDIARCDNRSDSLRSAEALGTSAADLVLRGGLPADAGHDDNGGDDGGNANGSDDEDGHYRHLQGLAAQGIPSVAGLGLFAVRRLRLMETTGVEPQRHGRHDTFLVPGLAEAGTQEIIDEGHVTIEMVDTHAAEQEPAGATPES